MNEPLFPITVDRLLRIRSGTDTDEAPFPLDADGFLDADAPIAGYSDALSAGALVDPIAALDSAVLVLLGEPGLGKSTVFLRLMEEMGAGAVRTHWIDAANLTDATFDEELGDLFRRLPAPPSHDADGREPLAKSSGHRDTVVIDQLDESPIVRRLPRMLRKLLAEKDTSGLRLLVACRTADYPPELTDVLRDAFGGCVLSDLAPLTREQAISLVVSAGVDGAEFIKATKTAAAGPLANVPLTLGLLMRSFQQDGTLDGGPRELFGKCVLQLLDEPAAGRPLDDVTNRQQRLAIASRAAAYLILCGRRTIWKGPALGEGSQDLDAGLLAGGAEETATGEFDVTPQGIASALATALFAARGDNRLAFRHSSMAAYMAAKYLIRHQVPASQLESLFLVAGPKGLRSIPEVLRETAAWLVNLSPAQAEWLVRADPQSLVAHSPLVDSFVVRELIVDCLLARADEVELSDVPWARSPWQLQHPGLGHQLKDVLLGAGEIEPTDWPAQARIRLAVRLARETRTSELAEPLLVLAEADGWGAHMRQLAAITAFETSPEVAAPRLRRLLDRFRNDEHARRFDPDDELRGSLLGMLWPHHVTTQGVLDFLVPQRRHDFFGSYRTFKSHFSERLHGDDVALVLGWAVEKLQPPHLMEKSYSPAATELEDPLPEEQPIGELDTDLLEALVDRGALASVASASVVGSIAALVWPRLRRYDNPPIPAPFALEDEEGLEPQDLRQARRRFAVALVCHAMESQEFDRGTAWEIIQNWRSPDSWRTSTVPRDGLRDSNRTQLLDTDDFGWVLGAADNARDDGNETLSRALGNVAALLFDPMDGEAVRMIYDMQTNPAWTELSWWFQPVPVESEAAEQMRRAHGFHLRRESNPWPESGQFIARLNDDLEAAGGGDTDAFWRLAWNLQYDPQTGRGRQTFNDEILEFPGVRALPEGAATTLRRAAMHFVLTEQDHAGTWLGTSRFDRRAWAGYLALALLDESKQIEEIQRQAWTRWTGALIWFHAVAVNAGNRDRKKSFLTRAAKHAPSELARSLERYIRGELARGALVSEVELVDPGWDKQIAWSWQTLLEELTIVLQGHEVVDDLPEVTTAENDGESASARVPDQIVVPPTADAQRHAIQLWESMMGSFLDVDRHAAVALARNVLDRYEEGSGQRRLAIHAVRVMLRRTASQFWPLVGARVAQDPPFGREVALEMASRMDPPDLSQLDEKQLEEIYQWLAAAFPPEEDREYVGAHFVSPEEQAREFRDQILRLIAERGSQAAIETLLALREEFPERLTIASNLIRARGDFFASSWVAPTVVELSELLRDTRRRFVRSSDELAGLLSEVLTETANALPHYGELLWDRIPKRFHEAEVQSRDEVWLPKPEASLSAYVTHELMLRLEGRGLAVNREVMVRPRNAFGAGDRTDVLVEATVRDHPLYGPIAAPAVVVIEVKGAWNEDVLTDLRNQLAGQYLPAANTKTGIYLVGWYPLEEWTDEGDPRRRAVRNLTLKRLSESIKLQSDEVGKELTVNIVPLVISISRPQKRVDSGFAESESDNKSDV